MFTRLYLDTGAIRPVAPHRAGVRRPHKPRPAPPLVQEMGCDAGPLPHSPSLNTEVARAAREHPKPYEPPPQHTGPSRVSRMPIFFICFRDANFYLFISGTPILFFISGTPIFIYSFPGRQFLFIFFRDANSYLFISGTPTFIYLFPGRQFRPKDSRCIFATCS